MHGSVFSNVQLKYLSSLSLLWLNGRFVWKPVFSHHVLTESEVTLFAVTFRYRLDTVWLSVRGLGVPADRICMWPIYATDWYRTLDTTLPSTTL